jgi:hypothetical protein
MVLIYLDLSRTLFATIIDEMLFIVLTIPTHSTKIFIV